MIIIALKGVYTPRRGYKFLKKVGEKFYSIYDAYIRRLGL
jgi:hypothetical protein